MKRFLLALFFVAVSVASYAAGGHDGQRRFDNIVVTSHGSYYEIVDNDNHVCIYIRVEEETNRFGERVYNLACENEFTVGVTKKALNVSLDALILALDIKTLGISSTLHYFSSDIANYIHGEICEYFR